MTTKAHDRHKPSNLEKLREWLTIPEAARHLALVFGEDVTEAAVLRLGLSEHLKLSVQFVNLVQAKRYLAADYTEEYEEHLQIVAARAAGLPDPVFEQRAPTWLEEECTRVVTLRDKVYDLPLVGGERLDVEQEYQRQTGGAEVVLTAFEGTFVDTEDGTRFQLHREVKGPLRTEPMPYYLEANVEHFCSDKSKLQYERLGRLPNDSVLVVRTTVLDEFIAHTLKPADEAHVHPPGAITLPADSTTDNVSVHPRSSLPTERRLATWKDVGIEFTSDHRVQVKVKADTYSKNYLEMGFENRKTGTPNLAWLTLRILAQKGGAIPVAFSQRKKLEKRIQEIRKTLRAHFATARFEIPLKPDPLPYNSRDKEYHALFHISTRPSFGT